MKYSNIFERIMQIADLYGYKSVNDFALNGLGYTHSEKINRLKNDNNKPSYEILLDISNKFEDIDLNWLINGVGELRKFNTKSKENLTVLKGKENGKEKSNKPKVQNTLPFAESEEGIPLIPIDAMAGYGEGDITVMAYEAGRYVVPEFTELHVEFMIRVKGSSMYPKYNSGDIVACKKLPLQDLFFQWNNVYVLDTTQGALIKRIKKGSDKNHILLVSDNSSYDPFELPITQIRAVSLVLGVIRLE